MCLREHVLDLFAALDVPVGYAVVDISMDTVRSEQITHFFRLVAPLLLALLIICVLGIIIVNHILIVPIRLLSEAASEYCQKNTGGEYDGFSKLEIHTGDEVESLADSMKKMEHDLNERIAELSKANKEVRRSRHIANEMTEMANRDALTGVRNKTAYDGETAKIDEEIKKGGVEFGIVMVDLNGLKVTNDTYGHEHGDDIIKGLCSLVSAVFDHSPVFRIGGDEFVVIVRGKQYKELDGLVEELARRISLVSADEKLRPWERVSAAVGCARFDPEKDTEVSSVFRRADEAMYENKRCMKAKQ